MIWRINTQNLSHEKEELAIPTIQWIGIKHNDLALLSPTSQSAVPLTGNKIMDNRLDNDRKKASDMLQRDILQKDKEVTDELTKCFYIPLSNKRMLEGGIKAEIQSVSSLSPYFLSKVYLPAKIGKI